MQSQQEFDNMFESEIALMENEVEEKKKDAVVQMKMVERARQNDDKGPHRQANF